MLEIGAFEAKNTLGSLLDRVKHGEEVLITRRGKPVARLVPAEITEEAKRKRARAALKRMDKLRKGLTLGELKIKDLINEGRR